MLVEEGGELVVRSDGNDRAFPVVWPAGYGVFRDGDTLVFRDLLGRFDAREGDLVHVGGGMDPDDDGFWLACGAIDVERRPPR